MSETRDSIVAAVKSSLNTLRSVEQKLNEAVIEEDVYTRALNMVISKDFESRYHNSKLFQLLLSRGRELVHTNGLSNEPELLKKWQAGLKVLLHYPMDLYLAPNRPELKKIKLTTGYFEYQINRRLTNAKEFLHEMGYEPRASYRSLSEYVLKNTSNLVDTIADLVILHQDLEAACYILETVRNMCQSKSVSGRQIILTDVLQSRQSSNDPSINGCVHYLMYDLGPPSTSMLQPLMHNSADSLQSLTTKTVVTNDGRSSSVPPKIKSRKNNPGFISRGSDSTSPKTPSESSITSIPPDPSQLPPPVMTQSELMRMLESKPEGSVSAHRNVIHDSIFMQSGNDVDSQIYRPFANGGYTSVLFSIGGDDVGGSKDMPLPSTDVPTYSGHSLQSLHRRSSEGSLLDQNPVKSNVDKYYSPPTHQRYPSSQYTNLPQHSSYQPQQPFNKGSYPVNSDITGGNRAAHPWGDGYANQGNMAANTKYSNNGDYHLKYPPRATSSSSSTWGGESPRQYLRQISEKELPSRLNNSSLKAIDLAVDPLTPKPWQCHQCKTNLGSDDVACPRCHVLAPFIDTDGTPPVLKIQHDPVVTPRRHIATDYTADTWVCVYCYTRNNSPKGSTCKECKQQVDESVN